MKITADLTDAAVLQTLGERVGRRRIEANFTQAALAQEAGVSKRTIERLEAGAGCELTKLIRVLRTLKLIDGFDALIPELPPSPLAELQFRGKQRRRATRSHETPAPSAAATSGNAPRKPWTWGEK